MVTSLGLSLGCCSLRSMWIRSFDDARFSFPDLQLRLPSLMVRTLFILFVVLFCFVFCLFIKFKFMPAAHLCGDIRIQSNATVPV